MNRAYDDIRSRLGEPLWFDGHGVPRYDPFHPEMCGVYDRYVAFVLIGCQACDQTFRVAVEWGAEDMIAAAAAKAGTIDPALPTADPDRWRAVGSFHYGDPPIHGCAGDTMNSVPLRILEFWHRPSDNSPNGFDWRRLPEHEIEIGGLEESE